MRWCTRFDVRRLPLAGMLLLCATVLWQGCGKSAAPVSNVSRTLPAIVVSGDTEGWITPCGCTVNQSGGLLRRATFLNDLRKNSEVVYLDAGGAGAGASPFEQLRLRAIFSGEVMMGINAHNLGKTEALAGPAALMEMAAATHLPLVSANTHTADGKPLAPPIRIVQFDGKRLAIIGIISSQFATSEIRVDDPRSAIETTINQHKSEYDWLIVLAYLPQDELMQLAQSTPEADAIVGGPTGQSIAPRPVGPVLLASATNKGKFLVRIHPPFENDTKWNGDVIQLDQTYADDPQQLNNLNIFLDDLRGRDFHASESGFAPSLPAGMPADYRVAGSESCLSCHAEAATIWQHSQHFQAGESLRPRKFDADPDCLRCHTTGYGLPGGFDSPRTTPRLLGVGCESCHGPSEAHVVNPHVHTEYAALDQCIRCHDSENSPTFDRAIFWQKIRHDSPSTRPSTGAVNQ